MPAYKIVVQTVDEYFAGTNSGVGIKLHFANTTYGGVGLDTDYHNDFKAGAKDEYTVTTDITGPLLGVSVVIDGSDEWRPDYIQVFDPVSGIVYQADYNGAVVGAKYGEWIRRDVYVIGSEGKIWPKPGKKPYKIRIKTSENNKNVSGAGTNASVYITLFNGETATKPFYLDNSGDDFEAGDDDVYEVDAVLPGPVTAVKLHTEGDTDEWHPLFVRIEDPMSGLIYMADFGAQKIDSLMKDGITVATQLMEGETLLAVDLGFKTEAEKQLLELWNGLSEFSFAVSDLGEGLIEKLIAFIQKTTGFQTKYVTMGGAIGGSAIAVLGGEAGAVKIVENGKIGAQKDVYTTATLGYSIPIGGLSPSVTGGFSLGLWNSDNVQGLSDWVYSFNVSAELLAGVSVSLSWSSKFGEYPLKGSKPGGIVIMAYAGASLTGAPMLKGISYGETWAYTKLWWNSSK